MPNTLRQVCPTQLGRLSSARVHVEKCKGARRNVGLVQYADGSIYVTQLDRLAGSLRQALLVSIATQRRVLHGKEIQDEGSRTDRRAAYPALRKW